MKSGRRPDQKVKKARKMKAFPISTCANRNHIVPPHARSTSSNPRPKKCSAIGVDQNNLETGKVLQVFDDVAIAGDAF